MELADGIALVYDELRRLAAVYIRRERSGHILQPTALVHEAWLQMNGLKQARWQNRVQFFAIASQVMRRILVSHARRRAALKRNSPNISILSWQPDAEEMVLNVLTVDDLLTRLEAIRPEASRVLEMRFFGGLTDAETAERLGISRATVHRHLDFGKAWMYRELNGA